MLKKIKKFFVMSFVNARWAYFHVSPMYIKFRVSRDSGGYFQHVKNGTIHANYRWVD